MKQALPHSREAEASVLGGILLRPEAIHLAAEHLQPEDFFTPANQAVYRAMLSLADRSQPLDLVTLEEQLKTDRAFDRAGGAVYLADLASRVPTTEHLPHYTRLVKDKAQLRRLITVATDLVAEAQSGPTEVQEFLDRAGQAIFDATQSGQDDSLQHVRPSVNAVFRRAESPTAGLTGVPTGFPELDGLTGGLQSGDLIVVAARPSMGKTALAVNLAWTAAVLERTPVALFSLEMTRDQLVERMVCSEARVNLSDFRNQRLAKDADWFALTHAADQLYQSQIHIDDTALVSVVQIRNKARRWRSSKSVFDGATNGLVVVDYLQLMRGRRGRSDTREREIADISRGLKALAKELHVPVVALSQLNRSVESRENKRPRLSDLRESGAIEQDADLVVFIYRDVVYHRNTQYPNAAELIIAKHRNGPIGTVHVQFWPEFTRFEETRRL